MSRLRSALGAFAPRNRIASTVDIDRLRAQLGGIESRQVATLGPHEIAKAEFQCFSQFGEDGIIQFLVQRVPIEHEVFVEFGVADYRESNTRFLLVHDNWRGLIMDGADTMHDFLRSTGLAWQHEIDARTAFIDRDNINDLIRTAGIVGDIGLLSIDLDGNDYWVLDAIEVVTPRVLIAEYNSVFGSEAAVTVPYNPAFVRGEKHWSWLYWGASLAALTRLAGEKSYALVGGNRAGNNAFYVRRDVLGDIPEVTVEEAYVRSRFRESRNRAGELSYISAHEDRLRLVADLPLFDLDSGRETSVGGRFGLER
ncbi:MAG TPA: hypothetical protein VGQ38_15275 [Gaiellaceae bacterium]|jgi:hypothetical protein|nr:hypothetical protein [Gaiellaceae bacterium]